MTRAFTLKSPGNDERFKRSRQLRRHMTKAETLFWDRVRNGRVLGLKFRRQQVIGAYILDFYCHCLRLGVELDGAVHDHQQGHDALRDAVLAKKGCRVLRFSNDEVLESLECVIARILIATGIHEHARPSAASPLPLPRP